jgi:hypothetical protein
MSAPVLGERRFGDILVRFHYINLTPQEIGAEHEPAIFVTRPEWSGAHSAYVIPESTAHQWVSSGKQGGPSAHAIHESARIARMLGLTVDRRTVFRIVEAVLDCIPDLLDMPPWQPPQRVVGEFDANMGGKRINGALLT